jgi:hypothetical protein
MAPKIKLTRPNRMANRMMKATNALNSMAELMAETVVAIQDAGQALMRVAEEIEEQEKEGT